MPASIRHGAWQGLPALLVETPWSRAAVSLHGGQLLSFLPSAGEDLLWLSPLSRRPPQAIRGGVPVCWPYFGREGQPAQVPQHGHARTSTWTLAASQLHDDGVAVLELALPPRAGTPLQLTQTLRLGRGLQQSLTTRNTGAAPATLTQALHSYFRVGDSLQVQVHGLDGLRYFDRLDGGQHLQSGAWDLHDPRDPGRSDRTYHQAGPRFVLHDPVLQRRIELEVRGSHALVAWNPGAGGVAALGDVAADGWRDFVCLETANAGEDVITLQPGQSHVLQQSVHLAPL